jgi:hypothetical protein
MMDQRPLGILLAVAGGAGIAVSALADPLGIGEGNVFGWLQLTGVILGVVVTLFGLAMALEVVPYPGRASARGTASSTPQATVITEDSATQGRAAESPDRRVSDD